LHDDDFIESIDADILRLHKPFFAYGKKVMGQLEIIKLLIIDY